MIYHVLFDQFNDITVYTTSNAYAKRLEQEYMLKPIVSISGHDLSCYIFHFLKNTPELVISATYYFQMIKNNEIKPPIIYLNTRKEKKNEKNNTNVKHLKHFKL